MVLTRDVPHASNGPDPNRLCIGSEGTLGIITEVTLRVRAQPEHREYRA
jgi:alkyldihydroxyacetonephosphate synthase